MNKLTKRSFSVLKYCSLGFILLFLLVKGLSLTAGHSQATSLNFVLVGGYSLLLFILTRLYQKTINTKEKVSAGFIILYLIVMVPSVILAFGVSIGVVNSI